MARNTFSLTTSVAVALTAATEKTLVQLTSGAAMITALTGLDITFDGTVNNATPVIVKIITVSTAGVGTARNPIKTKDTSTALLGTGTENHSAEGANANIMKIFHVHPQAGVVYPIPMRDEIEMAASTRMAIKVTAPAAVNALVTLYGEE